MLICDRGHRPPRGTAPKRCQVKMGHGVECLLPFNPEPHVVRCFTCNRGIYVDEWCSFCGAAEAPHGDGWGCTRCGRWFDTYDDFHDHAYGSGVTSFSAEALDCREAPKGVTKVLVSGGRKPKSRATEARVRRAAAKAAKIRAAGYQEGLVDGLTDG